MGPEGLIARKPAGAARRLTPEREAELAALIEAGPEFARDHVVRWRCVDLRAVIVRRFEVDVHVHTVSKWLNQLGLTRLQPRPFHPKKDPAAEEAYKKIGSPAACVLPRLKGDKQPFDQPHKF